MDRVGVSIMVKLMLTRSSVRVSRVVAIYIAYFNTVESYKYFGFLAIPFRFGYHLGSIRLDPKIGCDFCVFGSISISNCRRTSTSTSTTSRTGG